MACIAFADNNLNRMMRYIYCICFLVGSMGFPLLAKSHAAADLTPSSSGKGTKGVPSPSSSAAVTDAKKQNEKKYAAAAKPGDLLPSISGKGTKGVPTDSTSPAVTKATAPAEKRHETTLTSDSTRATSSAATLASNEQSKPAPARSDKKTAPTAPKITATTTSASKSSLAKSSPEKSAAASAHQSLTSEEEAGTEQRLARVTAYWAGEGDYYTGRCISATGVHLHDGHCAVDPNIIPYGSVVEISGVGKFLAVDTGSAVISRTAARESGHNSAERSAIVVDVFFEDAREGERFAAGAAKFVRISWWTPHSVASEASAAGGLFADENWTKIQSKQL
jgi:3D (Asp-Asp-Asp) domain-containing protein